MSSLQVDLVETLGTQGLTTRWLGRLDGAEVIVRLPSGGRLPQDAEARLLDAAQLLERHPIPGLPPYLGTVGDPTCPGLVLDTARGRTLRELLAAGRPDADAIEHLVHHVGTLLHGLAEISGRDPVRLRGLGLDTVIVRPDTEVVYEAVESAGGLWPKRAVRTRQLSRGDHEALPWTPEAEPADDVFDLGLLVVELLCGPRPVQRLLDAEEGDVGAYRVVWEAVARDLPLTGELGTLVPRMLERYPEERPRPAELVWGTQGGGVARDAMKAWFERVGPREPSTTVRTARTLELVLPPPTTEPERPKRRPIGPTVLTPLQPRWASAEAAARSTGRARAVTTDDVALEPYPEPAESPRRKWLEPLWLVGALTLLASLAAAAAVLVLVVVVVSLSG